MTDRPIRVLVIDDSAYNRRVLSDILEKDKDIRVIGKACDGEEGLELALKLLPDVITLDLEMPRMGGFPFLRILLSKKIIPVIVISAHSEPEKVVRALELGALDFVPKPGKTLTPDLTPIASEIVAKVKMAAGIDFSSKVRAPKPPQEIKTKSMVPRTSADRVVAIAASTGGPQALTKILAALPEYLGAAILIVQHMPPKFTTSFAERLDKLCPIRVFEATDNTSPQNGTAYISPGDASIELDRNDYGLNIRVHPPDGSERIVPSADRMFFSLAGAALDNTLGIVLTGMGNDGSRGAKALADNGGIIIAEDESTAVVPGMPSAAVAAGAVQQTVPLNRIADYIIQFVERR
jgi:two-component system chemotaxis response regulator CheB